MSLRIDFTMMLTFWRYDRLYLVEKKIVEKNILLELLNS